MIQGSVLQGDRVALRLQDLDCTLMSNDDRFVIATILSTAAVVNADQRIADREVEFVDRVLLRALGADTLSETNLGALRRAALDEPGARLDRMSELAGALSTASRKVIISLLQAAIAVDGDIDEREIVELRRLVDVMGLNDEPSMLSTAPGGSSTQTLLPWPKGVSSVDLLDLGPELRLALTRVFEPAPARQVTAVRQVSGAAWQDPLGRIAGALHHLRTIADRAAEIVCNVSSAAPGVERLRLHVATAAQQRAQLVVVGQFSAGKSTLINALIGEELLPSAAIPCSAAVCRVRRGPRRRFLEVEDGGRQEREIDEERFKRLIQLDEAEANDLREAGAAPRPELVAEVPNVRLPESVEVVDLPGLHEHGQRTATVMKHLSAADAVLLVMNAGQALGETDRELISTLSERLRAAGRPNEALFVVLNFADMLRTSRDAAQVRSRAMQFFDGRVATEDRIWLVSALGALDPGAVRHPPPDSPAWNSQFAVMEHALARFVSTGTAAGRVDRLRAQVLDVLEGAERDLKRRAAAIGMEAKEQERAKRNAAEALKRARTAAQAMLRELKQVRERASERAGEIVSAALIKAAQVVKEESRSWQSDKNVVFSRTAIRDEFLANARRTIERSIQRAHDEQLRPMLEREFNNLRRRMDVHALALEKALAAVDRNLGSIPPDAPLAESENGALARVLRALGGYAAGGPLGAAVGDVLGWEGVLVNLGANVAIGVLLAIIGAPFGPVGIAIVVAAVGAIQLFVGAEPAKQKIATVIAEKVAEAVLSNVDASVEKTRTELQRIFSEIEGALRPQLDAMLELRRRDIEILDAAAGAEAASNAQVRIELRRAAEQLRALRTEVASWVPR